MNPHKFDEKKLKKLNNPQRLIDIPPDVIWSKLNNQTPQTLVEIGAGTAFFCIAFLQRFKPNCIYAADLSETMIDWMQKNVVPAHPEIIPIKSKESQVPLDESSTDLVFMINLHHELENPEKSLSEAYRLLKSGGEIFIVDWRKQKMLEGPPTKIRCTPEQVQTQLQKAGFKQVSDYNDLKKHFFIVGRKP